MKKNFLKESKILKGKTIPVISGIAALIAIALVFKLIADSQSRIDY